MCYILQSLASVVQVIKGFPVSESFITTPPTPPRCGVDLVYGECYIMYLVYREFYISFTVTLHNLLQLIISNSLLEVIVGGLFVGGFFLSINYKLDISDVLLCIIIESCIIIDLLYMEITLYLIMK